MTSRVFRRAHSLTLDPASAAASTEAGASSVGTSHVPRSSIMAMVASSR